MCSSVERNFTKLEFTDNGADNICTICLYANPPTKMEKNTMTVHQMMWELNKLLDEKSTPKIIQKAILAELERLSHIEDKSQKLETNDSYENN